MIEKTCRCGKIKKNFQIDIGPFFIAECCTEAGYDHLGNKAPTKEEVQTALETGDLVKEVLEGKSDKKKRSYNRNGNLKKDE